MTPKNGNLNWTTLTNVGMLLLIIVGAFWALAFGPIQERFSIYDKHLAALDARRAELTTRVEFGQFQLRIIDRLTLIEKTLLQIESTRPTAGELQATARSADAQLTKLEERLRSLEVYLRQVK